MGKKKVIIIGGGVSGLTTAIYLKKHGYETLVLEKNAQLGGACVGWERKGCYIDGSIHWLVGTNPNSTTYKLWQDVGALSSGVKIFNQDDFYTLDFGENKKFTIWSDRDKLQQELIQFAPEDKKQIIKFCNLVKRFERIDAPVEKPVDLMNFFDLCKIGLTMCGDYYYIAKTSKISCAQYAKNFKNPYIRKWLSEHMSAGYNLMSFLYMFSHITAKNGGIPEGGSRAFVNRMKDKYVSLGGEFILNCQVKKINVEGDLVVGVTLENGNVIDADWVVSATPATHTLKHLLSNNYRVEKFKKRLNNRNTYPIYTYTTTAFKINADIKALPLSLKLYFKEPLVLEENKYSVVFRNYSYDPTLKTPEGHAVIQATISGNDDMYYWWKEKREKGEYNATKDRVAKDMLNIFINRFPELEGKVEIIDVITPLTYQRYLNGRHGSFQGFVQTYKAKALMDKGVIKNLKNFFLSGQWLLRSGGLPPALITGKFTAQRICKRDKIKFST